MDGFRRGKSELILIGKITSNRCRIYTLCDYATLEKYAVQYRMSNICSEIPSSSLDFYLMLVRCVLEDSTYIQSREQKGVIYSFMFS